MGFLAFKGRQRHHHLISTGQKDLPTQKSTTSTYTREGTTGAGRGCHQRHVTGERGKVVSDGKSEVQKDETRQQTSLHV